MEKIKKADRLQMPDNMYNQEQKEEFINDESHDKIGVYTFFRRSAQTETEFSKDVSVFTQDNLVDLFVNANWTSPKTVENMTSVLSMYVDWCIKHDKAHEDEYYTLQRFKRDGIPPDRIINKSYYFSESDLIERSSYLFMFYGYDVNYYAKYIVLWWLAFQQLDFDDVASIEVDDVDLTNETVTVKRSDPLTKEEFKREVLKISPQMYKYFALTKKATEYTPFNLNQRRPLSRGKYLLYHMYHTVPVDNPDIKIDKAVISTWTRVMTKLNDQLKKDMKANKQTSHPYLDEIPNFNDVYKSGLFCKLYSRCGTDATAKDVKECMVRTHKLREPSKLLADYQVWLANRKRVMLV